MKDWEVPEGLQKSEVSGNYRYISNVECLQLCQLGQTICDVAFVQQAEAYERQSPEWSKITDQSLDCILRPIGEDLDLKPPAGASPE